jgi:MFS family permease
MPNIFKPRETLETQNAWNLYADIAWFGMLAGVANSFLSVLVIRVGGSDTHVGLLSALPALITILTSLPGSRLVEREKKPLSILIVTAFLHRSGYLAIALVPFFLAANRADAIVVLVALLTIPGAVANVAFTTMFGKAVSPDKRAHVVAIRNVWIGITSTLTAFFGGKFLDQILFPLNYQILFGVAFVASLVSQYYLTRIRLPVDASAIAPRARAAPRGVRAFIAMLRGNRRYTQFTFASFIFHWGLFLPVPLYSIYWVRVLQASDGWIGLFSMVGSATTIVFYPLWGRLSTRYGNHRVNIAVTAGLALYPLVTALSPSVEWILFVSFLGGIFSSGFALAFFNTLLETSPEQNRASFVAVYNILINIAAFIAPLLGTSLTAVFGIHAILLLGAMMRALGALLFWLERDHPAVATR